MVKASKRFSGIDILKEVVCNPVLRHILRIVVNIVIESTRNIHEESLLKTFGIIYS